jgi:hypothetical protein
LGVAAGAAAALDFGWEAGVFTEVFDDQTLASNIRDFFSSESDEEMDKRHEEEAKQHEAVHLPEMIRRRNVRFAEIVKGLVETKQRAQFQHHEENAGESPEPQIRRDWQRP